MWWLIRRYNVLLLFVLLLMISMTAGVFIEYPSNITAPLNTTVTVECVADQPFLAWTIIGFQLLDQVSIDRFAEDGVIVGETEMLTGGNSRTTLTIPATDRTNVSVSTYFCQAGPDGFGLEDGPTVTFSVYGLPLAPGDVEEDEEGGEIEGQLTLRWSPPFTLPGETVSYSVLIQNLNYTTTATVSVPLNTTVYTHQSLTLSCHLFIFSVFSVNEVGSSINSSSTQPLLHPSGPGSIGTVETEVEFTTSDDLSPVVHLSFKRPLSCYPLNYSVAISREGGGTTETLPVLTNSLSSSEEELITLTSLESNSRYSVQVLVSTPFLFSILNPVTSNEVSFVTSGLQSVTVLWYRNNGTVIITCSFASGATSLGCLVTVSRDTTSIIFNISRVDDRDEVVYYSEIAGVPSSVMATELGVSNPLQITGSFQPTELPSPTSSVTPVSSENGVNTPITTPTLISSSETPTNEVPTDPSSSSSLRDLLTWAIPAGVGVAILALIVLFTSFCVCCTRSSKRRKMRRLSTLPRGLTVPHSSLSPTGSHDYKQVPPHISGTIKEMSFNPLYGDTRATTFDPPLPSLPSPSNGDTITLPSKLPPVYEEVSAARKAAKLASNPQYGAVGGANDIATPNPKYGSPPGDQTKLSDDHMYASLKDPTHLSTQQHSLQYAQPYEHVSSPSTVAQPTEGVAILTDDNVSYNAPSTSSPQKSLDNK